MKTGATDESRARSVLSPQKRGMGAGKERGLPIQARSVKPALNHHRNKSKHTLALAALALALALAPETDNDRTEQRTHPWQLELELHRVQLNSYTLDNLFFCGGRKSQLIFAAAEIFNWVATKGSFTATVCSVCMYVLYMMPSIPTF